MAHQYVNVTKMCQANGKKWNDYMRRKGTKASRNALGVSAGIPADTLVQTYGSDHLNELRGTWAHPDVAIDCAQ